MGYAPLEVVKQTVVINWHDMSVMPETEGTYLVAFDDGAVETYPMSEQDLKTRVIQDGYSRGVLWALPITAPKT